MTPITTPTDPPLCLGGCGYLLRSPQAQRRGYGSRCWAKHRPRPTPRPAKTPKPRSPRRRPRPTPGEGQLELTVLGHHQLELELAHDPTVDLLRRQHATIAIPTNDPTPARFADCPHHGPYCAWSRACRWPLCIPTTEDED